MLIRKNYIGMPVIFEVNESEQLRKDAYLRHTRRYFVPTDRAL